MKSTARSTSADGDSYLTSEPSEPLCPVCEGRGWVRKQVPLGHQDFGEVFPCQCIREDAYSQIVSRLQRYSNLGPLSHIDFSITTAEGILADTQNRSLFKDAFDAATQFAENPQGWLVFLGPSGCGKTHLAAAIANHCIHRSIPTFFISIPDLLDHLRATYAPESHVSYDDLFEQVRNVPLLVLDDLGTHSSSPWAQEKLFQVFNHRFNAALPTVITVRGPLQRLDEGIRSRLESGGLSHIYTLAQRTPDILQKVGPLSDVMLRDMTFQSFDPKGSGRADEQDRASLQNALDLAKAFASFPDGWLLFTGPNGCGKTHLAVAIVSEQLNQGQSIFWTDVSDLLDHLRATFAPESSASYDELFEQVRNATLLVLDDLGAERSTPWAEEKLYQIIAHRYNYRLPTLVTTTLEITDLEKTKPAIASRFKDPLVVALADITAPDYRDQQPKAEARNPRSSPTRQQQRR